SIGISLFGIDLYLNSLSFLGSLQEDNVTLMGILAFLQNAGGKGILIDLAGIGFFGGVYSVPLMALIQQRSDKEERAQTIAANNILNALFMVISAVTGALMLSVAGLSIPEYFLVVSIMNIVVAIYIYSHVPEFFLRFTIWILSHTAYRVSQKGFEYIPDEEAAVIVCNHVSYMDPLILASACARPVRFVMDKSTYNNPALNWFFKLAKTIPIASQKSDPELYNLAMERVSDELKAGNVVCIFPEGKLTKDGEVMNFHRDIETIINKDPVPVIPMALKGLWGSFFSHKDGAATSTRPTRFWSKISIEASEAWDEKQVSALALEQEVKRLRGPYQ
ncbi:MAG: 1-acyl-sn-glycerol-3-phosphate acyltransferase, partial [Gammaproteobacteria bacterium]|nr:1-acyl-sn-glycerol-3-phosphate acyltransferase [Gammaproteobacteria bacterium]